MNLQQTLALCVSIFTAPVLTLLTTRALDWHRTLRCDQCWRRHAGRGAYIYTGDEKEFPPVLCARCHRLRRIGRRAE